MGGNRNPVVLKTQDVRQQYGEEKEGYVAHNNVVARIVGQDNQPHRENKVQQQINPEPASEQTKLFREPMMNSIDHRDKYKELNNQ
jgi:hypothetical protein